MPKEPANSTKSDSQTKARCRKCGLELAGVYLGSESTRKACPECGSKARHIEVRVEDEVTIREHLAYKLKREGQKGPLVEAKSGASLHRKTGKWSNVEQVVDRQNNRYIKKIVSEDGEVIRDEDGKLSDHQGFGDAKGRRSDCN